MFDYIQAFIAEHRYSPLIREIQVACQITSYKSAIDRLAALEHKGFIKRIPNKHRGIKIKRMIRQTVPTPQEPAPVGEVL